MTKPVPESIRNKMLEDAGYTLPKMCYDYQKCIDLLKAIVDRNSYSLQVSIENAKEAKRLLKELGEIE